MTRILFCAVCLLYLVIVKQNYVSSAPHKGSRVCVIGAGYSGLGTARYMKQYGLNFTVFEAARDLGGGWRFDPHVGQDEDGLPLFTSMYKGLRMNSVRQGIEYKGFPFPHNTPSYPYGTCFNKYLKSFVRHFDLLKHIQYRSYVTSVKWKSDHWILTYLRTDTRKNHTEHCDFVVVANGLLTKPHVPTFLEQDSFKGVILHTHDYREPTPYVNRKVLLVGGHFSALDLALMLVNVTSKLAISHHGILYPNIFSKNITSKPDIDMFKPNGVLFQDGSFEEFDVIILCTGYEYDHHFLDETAEVTKSPKFVMPLYQHIVNVKHPSMAFVGKLNALTIGIFDKQAEYTAALAAQKFRLPSEQQMLDSWFSHLHNLLADGFNIFRVNSINFSDLDKYTKKLNEEAGLTDVAPVIGKIRAKNVETLLNDYLHFQEYDFEILNDEDYVLRHNPRGDVCPIVL